MRVTKKLKFVEGEGLEKLLKYTENIKAKGCRRNRETF